jgi:hypothetical protein
VLGTPPALTLSQDQTLLEISRIPQIFKEQFFSLIIIPTNLPPVKRYYFAAGGADVSGGGGGTSPSGGGGGTSGPAGGGGTAGALFGIACLIIKNNATRIMIIRITTAAGFCFFSAISSHLLSLKFFR